MTAGPEDPQPRPSRFAAPPTCTSRSGSTPRTWSSTSIGRRRPTSACRPDDVIMQVVAAMNSSVSINRNFWIDTKTGNQYFVAVQYPEDPDAHAGETCSTCSPPARNQTNAGHAQQPGQYSSRRPTRSRSTTSACTARSTCWSTPRTATSAAWPAMLRKAAQVDRSAATGMNVRTQGRIRAA